MNSLQPRSWILTVDSTLESVEDGDMVEDVDRVDVDNDASVDRSMYLEAKEPRDSQLMGTQFLDIPLRLVQY